MEGKGVGAVKLYKALGVAGISGVVPYLWMAVVRFGVEGETGVSGSECRWRARVILRWVVCGRGENERGGRLGWGCLQQIEREILERVGG
ncbi:hypothetical protein MRB53_002446 [Persea americana]|uniref:Uncharacterized protein n=1 Tax=Persea americana TaxID=3435 RepID=A0ACC2MVG1_PERAE|nr:hypothetical protein MRB53_002446 [Persea americana]